jgi:predicted PurR-regulated permease PerM
VAGENSNDVVRTSLLLLTLLALLTALFVGAELLEPIAFTLVFAFLLRPVIRAMRRLGIPQAISAAIVVLALLGILIGAAFAIGAPLKKWTREAPKTLGAARQKISGYIEPIRKAQELARSMESGPSTTNTSSQPASQTQAGTTPAAAPQSNESQPTNFIPALTRVFDTTTAILGGITEVLLLLLLILAAGDAFMYKLLGLVPGLREKKSADLVIHDSEAIAFRYMVVNAMINAGQGVVIGLIMWALGMPNPILWAILTFVFEFVPYLGAVAMMIFLAATAMVTFDTGWRMLLPPLAYLVVTTIQNNVVSPIAYGGRLKLNAVAVLLGVLVFWFLWGIVGAFLAVPLMGMMKSVFDRTQTFPALSEFLAE